MNTMSLRKNWQLSMLIGSILMSSHNTTEPIDVTLKGVALGTVLVALSAVIFRLKTKDRNDHPLTFKEGCQGFFNKENQTRDTFPEYFWLFCDDCIVGAEKQSSGFANVSSKCLMKGNKKFAGSYSFNDGEKVDFYVYESKSAYGFFGILFSDYLSPIFSGLKDIKEWLELSDFYKGRLLS